MGNILAALTPKERRMVEDLGLEDAMGRALGRLRHMQEGIKITGHVQFIKNQGREDEEIIEPVSLNLLTNVGKNLIHNAFYANDSDTTVKAAKYVALSTDVNGAKGSTTTMAGEILDSGLQRAAADTTTHSGTANTSILTKVFTATAAVSAVQMSALFDASTAGNKIHEAIFTPVNLEINDTLTITWTVSVGTHYSTGN